MLGKAFIRGAAERALKTFFQTFVAVLIAGVGAEAVGVSAGILQADWLTALSVAALATVLSVATSIGNADFTAGEAPQVPVTHVEHTYAADMSAEDVERLIVSLRSDKYPDTGQEH